MHDNMKGLAAGPADSDMDGARLALQEVAERQPPTIGVVGVSGTGKSSTINALFRTSLPVSHTRACTKEFRNVELAVEATAGPSAGRKTRLRVVDAPGLGEDLRKDPDYLGMYKDNLPRCDAILWVLSARNRAVALDQTYLSSLTEHLDRLVFGVNQVDLVSPVNWNRRSNLPSEEQEDHILEIIEDRKARLASLTGWSRPVVGYSAGRSYRLQELFTELVDTCPPGRSWMFGAIKNFRYDQFRRASSAEPVDGSAAPPQRDRT